MDLASWSLVKLIQDDRRAPTEKLDIQTFVYHLDLLYMEKVANLWLSELQNNARNIYVSK